jgi:hypothetical protein
VVLLLDEPADGDDEPRAGREPSSARRRGRRGATAFGTVATGVSPFSSSAASTRPAGDGGEAREPNEARPPRASPPRPPWRLTRPGGRGRGA